MKFKKQIRILLAVTMVFVIVALNVFADYATIKNELAIVDNVQYHMGSGYTDTEVIAYSIITSLRGSETVTLKTSTALDIWYTTGSASFSDIYVSTQTVSSSGEGTRSSATLTFDTTRIIDHFMFYQWFYANETRIAGEMYWGDYGVNDAD